MKTAIDLRATSRAPSNGSRVVWPTDAHPDVCPVYSFNEIETSAPPERVWGWLVRAGRWPEFYKNATRVEIQDGASDLEGGVLFSWTTFGVRANTAVVECVPGRRLAWTGKGLGATAYHGWVITPRGTGSHIVTEETQRGGIASLGRIFLRSGLHKWHQRWLEGLARMAEAGWPDGEKR